jgi:hypothetical protein
MSKNTIVSQLQASEQDSVTQFQGQNRMLIICVPSNKFPHIPTRE